MNGVPWWFCQGLAGPAAGLALKSVDPDGAIAAGIPLAQVVGCVVHAAAYVEAPGLADQQDGPRARHRRAARRRVRTRRAAAARARRRRASRPPAAEMIQRDIWYKLWGNMTTNPISAMTGATTDRVIGDELVRTLTGNTRCANRAASARRAASPTRTRPRNATPRSPRKLGAFKTSMLQDVEAGRAIELDSLVGAVRELGRHVGIETPPIDAIFGLARVFAACAGSIPEASADQRSGAGRISSGAGPSVSLGEGDGCKVRTPRATNAHPSTGNHDDRPPPRHRGAAPRRAAAPPRAAPLGPGAHHALDQRAVPHAAGDDRRADLQRAPAPVLGRVRRGLRPPVHLDRLAARPQRLARHVPHRARHAADHRRAGRLRRRGGVAGAARLSVVADDSVVPGSRHRTPLALHLRLAVRRQRPPLLDRVRLRAPPFLAATCCPRAPSCRRATSGTRSSSTRSCAFPPARPRAATTCCRS